MDRNFAVFILSHGRAGKVYTFDTLRKQGYSGKIYIIIDNEDEQESEYKKRFKNVIVFDKKKYAEITDTADNLTARNVVVFARNACWDIAEKIGLTHFLVLDDDYTNFEYRYPEGEKLKTKKMMKLDGAFEKVLDFLDVSGAVTVALAQGGDFIGGVNNKLFKEGVARKAMNSFFCRTDRPFEFYGRINEDTTAYIVNGNRGQLFFTVANLSLHQIETQSNSGGLTEMYLELGTYVKSFYTVMYHPSGVDIRFMGNKHMRLHHSVHWNNCVPCIVPEKYKKT